jgi:hypothetical protein
MRNNDYLTFSRLNMALLLTGSQFFTPTFLRQKIKAKKGEDVGKNVEFENVV